MPIEADLSILGGGPGGYTAAIRAAQAGKSVVLIEENKIGGTCLHKGCIPTKSLLHSANLYHQIKHASAFGVEVEDEAIRLHYGRVHQRKQEVVDQLYGGLRHLMRKHGIQVVHGKGRIIGPSIFSPRSGSVAVELADGDMETVVSSNLMIATGSRPRMLQGLEPDGIHILNSDQALELEQLPNSLLIIGGGVIGVEWASLLSDFGVEVTLVEMAARLLPGEDADISNALQKAFRARGIRVLTNVQLELPSYAIEDGRCTLQAETSDGPVRLQADQMLVCVGRQANCETIGLENTDVEIRNGVIAVNRSLQTTEPHIYAIGDVTGGVQLAHAAAHEGLCAVEHLLGSPDAAVYEPHRIPRCIYARPEIASIGWTEAEARKRGMLVKVGKIPFQAIGKAVISGEQEGFVKVVAEETTGDLLGVHIIGAKATELIAEASLAQLLDATPWEIGQAIHPHPSLSEALGEAMLAVNGQALVY
ncbi:dihydrolipoyl dehydrogenase [Paenibacillus sp. IB182496]|uniref:Dihydrolipoyl dehydrogenase n=1 Tax=Paenibacillus sabuli TaxID=2772509 RepID=A0A927BX15_9BACL|nr:dihydrolipoyl dehydrogenase [Paenibacillus sabuli]MBD2847310.1 dihydrolipoyl dehydrogenase [Paenibacillus sabuli]